MKALTPEEVLKVLKAAQESKRNHAAILLGFRHGLRASEVCNLRLTDVDLKAGEITIRRLKGSLKTTQPLVDLPGQPLLDEPKALRQWLEERQDDSEFFFTSQKGGSLTTNAIWRLFKTAARTAGIEGRSVHALKHSRVSHLLAGGAPISEVRQVAGHRALSSTLRYVHSNDKSAAEAARKAEAAVF